MRGRADPGEHAHRRRAPQRRRGVEAPDVEPFLEDHPGAEEADAGDDLRRHPRWARVLLHKAGEHHRARRAQGDQCPAEPLSAGLPPCPSSSRTAAASQPLRTLIRSAPATGSLAFAMQAGHEDDLVVQVSRQGTDDLGARDTLATRSSSAPPGGPHPLRRVAAVRAAPGSSFSFGLTASASPSRCSTCRKYMQERAHFQQGDRVRRAAPSARDPSMLPMSGFGVPRFHGKAEARPGQVHFAALLFQRLTHRHDPGRNRRPSVMKNQSTLYSLNPPRLNGRIALRRTA